MKPLRFAAVAVPVALAAQVATFTVWATAAFALAPTPVQNLLLAGRNPADLRARLLAHADSVRTNGIDAGEAWYHAGLSWARGGSGDSALVVFERARAVRGNVEETVAAVDVLLARGAGPDLDSATALLAPVLQQPGAGGDEVMLRDAWIRARRGDSAALVTVADLRRSPLFRPLSLVANRALWAWRFAPLALAAGAGEAAWRMVSPLAVATRGRDAGIAGLARSASVGRSLGTGFDSWLTSACARADTVELATIRRLGGKPLAVKAEDGAVLNAWYVPGPPGAAIAVVTAPAGSEQAAACDSLVTQLRRARLAVALLEPRGVRRSASATEPPALLRTGREEADQRRLARDLRHALTAAGRAAGVAAPRSVMVGVGPDVMAAVLASAADARVQAVVLAGPEIAPGDRGWLRETLAVSGVPAFFETGPDNITQNLEIDRIVAALPPAQCRVADSRSRGHGAALFRAGPEEGARLAGWISGTLKKPRATPPAPPR